MDGVNADLFHGILAQSFDQPSSVPGLIEHGVTRDRSLNSKDRRRLTDLLYDALRWRRRIFGDIAPSRIVLETVARKIEEARALAESPPLARWNTMTADAQAREVSFPTWIYERWVNVFGFPEAARIALALNKPAPVTLRTNILKTRQAELKAALEKEDVVSTEGTLSPWALTLKDRRNLEGTAAYRNGWFEVQDEASQATVLASAVRPGDLAVDACAGAGGKSLALAAMMKNRGKILALDTDARRLSELEKRAKRAGVEILEPKWVAPDDPAPLSAMREMADVVFIDAPCSAFGTLRRRPWMKWSATSAQVKSLAGKQSTLLGRYAPLTKPGGKLLYVTCTIDAEENEDVVNAFLGAHTEFQPASPFRLFRPDTDGTDGFFVAVLKRS